MALSLEPLHSHPELIEDTIRILKDEWPDCLAERLREIETRRCSGLPCSLVLFDTQEGAVKDVIGHVRVLGVSPVSERRVYLESVVIKKEKRGKGLARELHAMAETYAKTHLGARYTHASVAKEENMSFYPKLGYENYQPFPIQITGNVLRTYAIGKWDGNIIPEEWKYLYDDDDGYLTREEAMNSARRFVKDLGEN